MEALQALGINWWSLLWHTINFGVLLFLLVRFLYRPVIRMLDQRALRIKESMERAEMIKEQLARTEEATRLQMETARREGQAIVDQAGQIAERMRAQARQEAQSEADKIVANARAQIEHERDQAMADLRREVAGLVVAAAGKVISESLDEQAHHRLVEEFLGGNGHRLND